jgi:hypothetical protein
VRLAKACLTPDLAERPRHAGVVAEAVAAYQTRVQERLQQAEVARAQAQARAEEERKRRRLALALAAAVGTVLLLGGGGWLWVTEERAARLDREAQLARAEQDKVEKRNKTIQAAEARLQRAVELRLEARSAPPDDLTRWNEAFAVLKEAAGLLTGGEADPQLRQRTQSLLHEMETEARDRRFLAKLDEAALQGAGRGTGKGFR